MHNVQFITHKYGWNYKHINTTHKPYNAMWLKTTKMNASQSVWDHDNDSIMMICRF